MTEPQQPNEDATVHLRTSPPPVPPQAPRAEPEATVRLGPVKTPAADATVRLGAAPVPPAPASDPEPGPEPDPESTVRLEPEADPEATVKFPGTAPAGGPEATVRLDQAPPRAADPEATVKFGAAPPAGAPEATVRLGLTKPPVAGGPEPTVQLRLGGAALPPAPAGPPASVPDPRQAWSAGAAPQPAGFESATFLDPEVWPTVAPPAPTAPPAVGPAASVAPPAAPAAPAGSDEGLHRFGPGVPPQAAAVWHGAAAVPAEAARPRRRRRWLLIPLVLLVALLAWLAWDRYGRAVAVTGVTVRTDNAQGPSCDGTAVVTGTLATDGGAGTVSYRWRRSDGTDSGVLTQQVPSGRGTTEVVLRWTFQGKGTMQATATLEVLSPGTASASVSFPYTCR